MKSKIFKSLFKVEGFIFDGTNEKEVRDGLLELCDKKYCKIKDASRETVERLHFQQNAIIGFNTFNGDISSFPLEYEGNIQFEEETAMIDKTVEPTIINNDTIYTSGTMDLKELVNHNGKIKKITIEF